MKITESILRKLIREELEAGQDGIGSFEDQQKEIQMANMRAARNNTKIRYIIGRNIVQDGNGHATEHLGHDILQEALERFNFNTQGIKRGDVLREKLEFDHPVAYNQCVETGPEDKIIYVRRGNRKGPSRFVLNRRPEQTNVLVLALAYIGESYDRSTRQNVSLWTFRTAYGGNSARLEPWHDDAKGTSVTFWLHHALVVPNDLDYNQYADESEFWGKFWDEEQERPIIKSNNAFGSVRQFYNKYGKLEEGIMNEKEFRQIISETIKKVLNV